MGPNTQHTKRRIVDSLTPWGLVAPIYRRAGAKLANHSLCNTRPHNCIPLSGLVLEALAL